MKFFTHETAQTEEVAAFLAPALQNGDVLLLQGGLGAGKTAFVRGLVRGLDGDENDVSSPTFALMNRYDGRLTLYHFDLYRLSGEDEVYDLGFDEIFRGGDGVCAVEWSRVAGDLWDGMRVIEITLSGENDERCIAVEGINDFSDFGRLLQCGIGVAE